MKVLKIIFSVVSALFFVCSQSYCIEYSLHSLAMRNEKDDFFSQPKKINNEGTIVGKLRESDKTYTDFVWKNGKTIYINPKCALRKQFPQLNDKDEVIGFYWKRNGDNKELRLYSYDLQNGFKDIAPPKNINISLKNESNPEDMAHIRLLGYSNEGQFLVANDKESLLWSKGSYHTPPFPSEYIAYKLTCNGKILFKKAINAPSHFSGFSDLININNKMELNYFDNNPSENLCATTIVDVLNDGTAIGYIAEFSEQQQSFLQCTGFKWNPTSGYTFISNFIPFAGNVKGEMIGILTSGNPEDSIFKLWKDGKFCDLNFASKEMRILDIFDLNDKGQIIINGGDLPFGNAYLLTPIGKDL